MLFEWNGSYLALRKNGVNSLIIEKKMVLCNTNMHIRLKIKIKLHSFFFFKAVQKLSLFTIS
jgi:hypothetical protein